MTTKLKFLRQYIHKLGEVLLEEGTIEKTGTNARLQNKKIQTESIDAEKE